MIQSLLGYLLAWMLTFDLFKNAVCLYVLTVLFCSNTYPLKSSVAQSDSQLHGSPTAHRSYHRLVLAADIQYTRFAWWHHKGFQARYLGYRRVLP